MCHHQMNEFFLMYNSIGFKNVCTIEDIQKAYPFLDMVDHDNRKRVVRNLVHCSKLNATNIGENWWW